MGPQVSVTEQGALLRKSRVDHAAQRAKSRDINKKQHSKKNLTLLPGKWQKQY